MASHFISIRGFSLIGLGMAGWLIGSYLIKTGVQSWNTSFYSMILFMICFIAIILGIALWGYDVISGSRRSPDPESTNENINSRQKISPRENKSLTLAGAGILLIIGAINFLGIWNLGSRDIWLFTGVYCAVAITGFSLLYNLGYYVLFRSP